MRLRNRRAPALRRRRIRKLRLLALAAVLGALGLASFSFGLVTAVASQIPALDPARQQHFELNSTVYASDGHSVLAVLRGSQSRALVPSSDIAGIMKQSIVAIEDKRFYEHRGIDLHGIARAIWADVRHRGVVEGGSTITQQFVKNAYVTSQRSIARKLKEAALAWQLEQRRSKDWILTAYLNTIYFGNGAYGIQQAAETYFGHGSSTLTLPEAALLAGIPEDPTLYDPVTDPQAARARRALVLRALLDQGDISQADFAAADATPLPAPEDVHLPGTEGPAPYFVNYVKQQLAAARYDVLGGGLEVRTTIDLRLQRLARAAISTWLTDPNGPQAALVSIDPRDGRVLAMVGGDYRKSQFNLAVQGERQPGSSFKPFVLATALQEGIAPSTVLDSAPQEIPIGGRVWKVKNYEGEYLGPIDLATATAKSDNAVYAQLTRLVGPASVVRTAKAAGITSRLRSYFAIGLGAEAVNPLEMARAYSTFANGGLRVDGSLLGNAPRTILSVERPSGRTVEDTPIGRRELRPDVDALLNSILQTVVTSGTGANAALPGREVAGKTGTTENYGDAWFVGYTPQLVTAVWVGYPARLRPMETEFHGGPVAGGTFPALIWKSFTEQALATLHAQPESFPAPPPLYASAREVTWHDGPLRLDNGVCGDRASVEYFAGYGPTRTADCKPNEVDVPSVVGESLDAAKARLAAQPLAAAVVYKPATAGQPTDVVVGQIPRSGTLSASDTVTLVLPRALHGVVPRLVGLPLATARARLATSGMSASASGSGPVSAQDPAPGVAAAPGMVVRLTLGGTGG